MLLTELCLRNFRCFEDISMPMHRLTVFIGENDAGKTAILDALQILLANRTPAPSDYHSLPDGTSAEPMLVSGTFLIEQFDTVPPDWQIPDRQELQLCKSFSPSGNRIYVNGCGYADDRWNSFARQTASVQRELLSQLGFTPGGNQEQRNAQFAEAANKGVIAKQAGEVEVRLPDLVDLLPRFELIASSEYKHPDSMVQRTFQAVLDSFLRPEKETGERELREDLQNLRAEITQVLDAEVAKITATLQRANTKLVEVHVSPQIDFARSLGAVNLMVDVGEGLRMVDSFGEGTKKKLWMGLLDWQREAQKQMKDICVIRAYDEPDVNLDYAAERKLFSNILEETRAADSRTQSIVATHAVTLVDRAPGSSINLIQVQETGQRNIEYISADSDDEVRAFLATIGRTIGLSNSALFYERAFLVVEGESEENALPVLYRNLYGHSMIEDGIVLIQLFTCSAWKATLHILQKNKSDQTILLLDQDCNLPGSSAVVTEQALLDIGYPASFLATNCRYIGTKEFEDAFRTEDILLVLNDYWHKEDGSDWVTEDVDQFRSEVHKFSQNLLEQVRKTCIKANRGDTKKPKFAERLAEHCVTDGHIPAAIKDVFQALRHIAGA